MLTRTRPMPWVAEEYWLSPLGGTVRPSSWARAGRAETAASRVTAANRGRKRASLRTKGLLQGRGDERRRSPPGMSTYEDARGSVRGFVSDAPQANRVVEAGRG